MAEDKMTWAELRREIAQAANVENSRAERFLDALMESIVEGLQTDKQVKIKGLGTFAVKQVAPRRSVNISTGEAFVIEGYNKLTFNTESTLKENVEKRIERPKTDEIMADLGQDPMRKLGEQADEIVDILADLGQSPKKKGKTQETPPAPSSKRGGIDDGQTPPTPSERGNAEEDARVEEQNVTTSTASESVVKEKVEEPVETAKADDNEQNTPIMNENIPTNTASPKGDDCPKKGKCGGAWIGWAVAGVLLAVLIGGCVYFRSAIQQWWECMGECQPTEVTEVVEVTEPVEIVENDTPVVVPLAEQPREYTRFIGTERVGFGSRLAWISYKYYGVKDLWVFIYEANRDQIEHPNHLEYGKMIRVPLLSEKLMDLSDPETRQLIDNLQKEYLGK